MYSFMGHVKVEIRHNCIHKQENNLLSNLENVASAVELENVHFSRSDDPAGPIVSVWNTNL